jgi:hypothetical protein
VDDVAIAAGEVDEQAGNVSGRRPHPAILAHPRCAVSDGVRGENERAGSFRNRPTPGVGASGRNYPHRLLN